MIWSDAQLNTLPRLGVTEDILWGMSKVLLGTFATAKGKGAMSLSQIQIGQIQPSRQMF